MSIWKEILATCVGVAVVTVTTILAVKCNEDTANKAIDKTYDIISKVTNLSTLSTEIIN